MRTEMLSNFGRTEQARLYVTRHGKPNTKSAVAPKWGMAGRKARGNAAPLPIPTRAPSGDARMVVPPVVV